MDQPAIFSATLGLSQPWLITAVSFSTEEKRMDITVDFAHDGTFICPTCGAEVMTCTEENETWFHSDFFRYATYLHARVPHIECSCCGMCKRSREGSKFALIQ
jgi:hypothetical protein